MKYKNIENKLFRAWQPSTWPKSPTKYDSDFNQTIRTIFEDSLLAEIKNVVNDAPTLEHRGHVVALSILCAIDALSSYAFKSKKVGVRYEKYIQQFFPLEYKPYALKIYKLYRNSITHSWNLFQVGMLPDNTPIQEVKGTIVLGLYHLLNALEVSVDTFLNDLQTDVSLQNASVSRYTKLKKTAVQ